MPRLLTAFTLAVLLVSPVFAYAMPPAPPPPPPMKMSCLESATLNVNFSLRASSFMESKQKFDEKMKAVAEFARQQHIDKLTLQSLSYNVNPQRPYNDNEEEYQLSGNVSYRLDSPDEAFKLADFLAKQHFTVSVNVNRYGGNVMCPMNKPSPPPSSPSVTR